MIHIVNGSLLTAEADVICQQVNCKNAMGAGLAKSISTKWPFVKRAYSALCDEVGTPWSLLGRVQIVRSAELPFDVANIFGQLDYGRDGRCYTDYEALNDAFIKLKTQYSPDKRIAFPYGFGCGLAGGDWDTVLSLIDRVFTGRHVYIYKPDNSEQQ